MRIGVEACTWSNRRGYGRFTRELVTAMVRDYPAHEFILVVDQHTAAESEFPPGATVEVVETAEQPTQAASADGSRSPADLLRLSRAVGRMSFDVFLFPTRYSFYPLFCRTPTVVAFHDATAERHPKLIFPGLRSRLFWRIKTRWALHRADQLVTVSEDARREISTVFNYPQERIRVVTEGPDPAFRRIEDPQPVAAVRTRFRLPADEPLVVYVGGISPHKNLQGLLHAMARIRDESSAAWHLALVGDYQNDSFWGCYNELVELAGELALSDHVTYTGYVEDADLVLLYNTATCLVLPSMSEGFGLPVVEAMACGLPVAASNRNSIPEVLGDAGLLFDPTSHTSIAEAIARLLGDSELRASCRAKGLSRATQFSWEIGASTMVDILEEVAGERARSA